MSNEANRKGKRGRKPGRAARSGIDPHKEQWSDIINRLIYGAAEWRIVALRAVIRKRKRQELETLRAMQLRERQAANERLKRISLAEGRVANSKAAKGRAQKLSKLAQERRQSESVIAGLTESLAQAQGALSALENGNEGIWRLADNYLSVCASVGRGSRDREELELSYLWREFKTEFERAVLAGDATWFQDQAKAIDRGGMPQRAQFNAKVVHLLEMAMWRTRAADRKVFYEAEKRSHRESYQAATLTPAGKFTRATAKDIYDALDKRDLPNGYILVEESWQAENKERVITAINELARQLQFELGKLRQRKTA